MPIVTGQAEDFSEDDSSEVSRNGEISGFCDELHDIDFSKLDMVKPRLIETVSMDEKRFADIVSSDISPASFAIEDAAAPNVSELPIPTPFIQNPICVEGWRLLHRSFIYYYNMPVGTIAAAHDSSSEALNYDQVFVRDFVASGLAFLMTGQTEIVKNFLRVSLRIQNMTHTQVVDQFRLAKGVMPASFKVQHDLSKKKDIMVPDFGGTAIGRVTPMDSGFWWIILLRAYVNATGDRCLSDRPEFQKGIHLILSLCLSEGFDTFPTLLCADGCCMIDRRMGIYGYPIEIQALFYMALGCGKIMLRAELSENKELLKKIDNRLAALRFHIRSYFWLDFQQLNNVYRYKTEEYSHTAVNKFNVIPDSIPDWVFDFMPMKGGYFVGNVSPARMDFRWFTIGNCIAILSSLATPEQANAIMDLINERWQDLIGEMPMKISYPALEGHEWRIVTGCDPKNTRWSYHNGGSWPVLLWLLTAACLKTKRPAMAQKAVAVAEARLLKDGWPEYYDGKNGRYIGKQARKSQTWSVAGFLVAKMLLDNPKHLDMISFDEEETYKQKQLLRSMSAPF